MSTMTPGIQGLWMGTVVYFGLGLAICIISYCLSLAGKGFSRYDNTLFMFLTLLAVVQMWLVWICVYLSQLNPVIYPYVNVGDP